MTGTIRCISRMNLSLLTSNVTRQFMFNGCRTIYTDSSLGMTDYRKSREAFLSKYQIGVESFRTKMQNVVTNEKEMVFTEDLKAILHLVEKTPEEVELLRKCIEKFNTQSAELRFSSFKFGPIVMRALYYLNEPDLAKELFLNSKLDSFFDQLSTFLVLMDLLYENGKYTDVMEVYDKIRKKFVGGIAHPKLAVSIVGLACFKLNTPESLEYGLAICKDLQEKGVTPLRRFVAILGALALKQNKPEIALELASTCSSKDYVSIRCIRIMGLAQLNQLDDIIITFQASMKRGVPEKNQYYKDTIAKVEDMVVRLNVDDNAEIHDILRIMKDTGYVYDMTLEEHIQTPIQTFQNSNIPKISYHDEGWADSRRRDSNEGSHFRRPNSDFNFTERKNQYNSG